MQFFQMWQKVNLLRAFFPLLTHKMPDIEREKGRVGKREGERGRKTESALEIGAESTVN